MATSRRNFLQQGGMGFGSLALASMLAGDAAKSSSQAAMPPHQLHINPLAKKPAYWKVQAKSVIFLFMAGGPSQEDNQDLFGRSGSTRSRQLCATRKHF